MSDQTVEERLAAVQKQAEAVDAEEGLAKSSNYTAIGVGFGLTYVAYGGPVALVTLGVGLGSSALGSWLAEELNAAEHLADGLAFLGMNRIGQPGPDGPNPATVSHAIAHSYALWGFLGGVLLGALAAVAVGALIVATGGAAAVALIGAAAAGGLVGGFAGTTLTGALSQFGARTGLITTGSPDVLIAGLPAARMTDVAACTKDLPLPSPIIEGSETILINGLPLARKGHKLLCGAVIDEGAVSVVVDKTTTACARPASEVPLWLRVAVDWAGVLLLARFLTKNRPNSRLPQDKAVNPKPPKRLPWQGRKVGTSKAQHQALQKDIQNAIAQGATDIRVNQQQVNAQGQRVGTNRPDLQYTLNRKRYYIEYEGPTNPRGNAHKTRIKANDPKGNVEVKIIP